MDDRFGMDPPSFVASTQHLCRSRRRHLLSLHSLLVSLLASLQGVVHRSISQGPRRRSSQAKDEILFRCSKRSMFVLSFFPDFIPQYVTLSLIDLLQPTYLYTLAYYLKTHDWWTKDYIAAYYAVRLEYFSDGMPIGQLLLRYPFVLPFLTWASLVWEGYGCLLY